jgi:hypothetical protein
MLRTRAQSGFSGAQHRGDNIMPTARVRLSVTDARSLSEGALRGIGYDEADAAHRRRPRHRRSAVRLRIFGLAKILNIPESKHFQFAAPAHEGAAR